MLCSKIVLKTAEIAESMGTNSAVVLRVLRVADTQPPFAFQIAFVSKAVLTDCAGLRSERERKISA
jgi:hypothetical protein